MIAVVDYGAGNLSSVVKAISRLGRTSTVTSSPDVVRSASVVILPGVGAAGDAMAKLHELSLSDAIVDTIRRGVPFLGICLGLQVLLTLSEESGGQRCLDIVPGTVRRLPAVGKVPHIGWNQVVQRRRHPIFNGIADASNFYFVHSYYPDPVEKGAVVGETEYGLSFCSALAVDNIVATQFHPEKSGQEGLKLMENFFVFATGHG